MKIGSLVECINNVGLRICAIPQKNTIYCVRGFNKAGGIWLEEIENPLCHINGDEWGYLPNRFREVMPPVSNIEELINENIL